VVGSGPAGSVAALVLARGGARVALVDKARFPRDKACGDLVGPRAVRVLEELGIPASGARRVDDMVVVGPTGRRVDLPCPEGTTYPGHAIAVPRSRFDALLHDAAVSAGAEPRVGRAEEPRQSDDGSLRGFRLSTGEDIDADIIVGADGATSRVGKVAGLVDPERVLWGFAMRSYVDDQVTTPHIVFWDSSPRRGFPGYGWLFPGVDGRANVGLGIGTLSDRSASSRVAAAFDSFSHHLLRTGVAKVIPPPAARRLGGWLKMGIVGTVPASGRVLLVGDAAGLVNPLQGEGISQAMTTGRAAAEAVLAGPAQAAGRYRTFVGASYGRYHGLAAAAQRKMLGRPRVISAAGRFLTLPGVGRPLAGSWSIFWNDLLDGALPGGDRRVAAGAMAAGRIVTAAGATRHWLNESLG